MPENPTIPTPTPTPAPPATPPAPAGALTPTPSPAPGATPTPDPAPTDPPEADLGEAGKRALAAERAARKVAEKAAADAQAKIQAFENEKLSELEKAQKQAEQDRAVAARATERAAAAEIRAGAAGLLIDPADALRYPEYINPATLTGADGSIDAEALSAAITALLAAKPHLAAAAGPRLPAPDPSQGPRMLPPLSEADQTYEAIYGPQTTGK